MIKVLYPVVGTLTQGFGGNAQAYAKFNLPGHNGLDWAVPINTEVKAAQDGILEKSGWDQTGYGNYIKLRHKDEKGRDYFTLYAHFNTTAIKKEKYKAGETIGYSGSTGNSTGPHLHFELIIPWEAENKWKGRVDPTPYLVYSLDDVIDDNINEGTPSVEIKENSIAVVNADLGLRIRQEPNLNGKIWMVAPFGTQLNVGKIKDGWAEIIFYASAEYLQKAE